MSFRSTNKHDAWCGYCEQHALRLSEIGLPAILFKSDRVLADFLTTGYSEDRKWNLDRLDNDRFWQLFDFVDNWFDFDTITFTAMESRRIDKNTKPPSDFI
jgi:hypothetical protein